MGEMSNFPQNNANLRENQVILFGDPGNYQKLNKDCFGIFCSAIARRIAHIITDTTGYT